MRGRRLVETILLMTTMMVQLERGIVVRGLQWISFVVLLEPSCYLGGALVVACVVFSCVDDGGGFEFKCSRSCFIIRDSRNAFFYLTVCCY
jgi:hypothetical protein